MQDAQTEEVWLKKESTMLVALTLAVRFQGLSGKLMTAALRETQNKTLTAKC